MEPILQRRQGEDLLSLAIRRNYNPSIETALLGGNKVLDMIIVGAGPAGLATAIAAKKAGLDYRVIEKGVLVNSIMNFPRNMVFFTTPDLLEIGGLPFTTPFEKPTRAEALRYYRRVCDTFQLQIQFNEEVLSIVKPAADGSGEDGLKIATRSAEGVQRSHVARTVVLATGYYDHPNYLGIPGEDLPHVSHYYSEPHPFYRKNVLIVGGKNSAAEAALDLYRAGAHVTLIHRRARLGGSIKYWVKPDIENRIREGSIAARFNTRVVEIGANLVVTEYREEREGIPADAVFLLTGYHPDKELLEKSGVVVDEETMEPDHDPETLETNIPGIYLAGSIVAGKEANRIFIENGRFHGEVIVRAIRSKLAR
jgi:thioredoxin reductase (NADPH)